MTDTDPVTWPADGSAVIGTESSKPASADLIPTSPVAPPATPAPTLKGTTQSLTRLRRTIAGRMVDSLRVSAQLTTIVEVDVTEVGRLRRQHNSALAPGEGIKLTYLPFIAAAALAGLRAYPQVNSTVDIEAGTITYPAAEHLGIAVDTDKGLFVPVIRDAGALTVTELATRIADVAERTRTNKVTVDELSGGTFTITNTGSRGALMDTPIINQPQVAILGTGIVSRRPVIRGREGENESIAIRSMVYLSLTYDHRVVDGAEAARYLSDVKSRLERASFDL
jgi:pyruvate/2-oxoglutarate dehydrogenase complex dihydrolipoamide acyltransferase (E2) component